MLKISGKTFRECGYQIGTMFQKEIQEETQGYNPEEHREWLKIGLPLLQKHAKRTYGYLMGVAEGSDVPFIKVFMSWYEELPTEPLKDKGCTDISFQFSDRGPILLHTNDVEKGLKSDVVLLDVKGFPIVTMIGMWGAPSVAVNSNGFVFSGNQIDSNDERPGIPRMCLLFESLFCSTMGEIIKTLLHPARASSYNNIVADNLGDILTLEASALEQKVLVHREETVLVHTNHFIYLPEKEARVDESFYRSKFRLERALLEAKQLSTLYNMLGLLQTHGWGGACRHGEDSIGVATNFSVAFFPMKQVFLYGEGLPCKTTYKLYRY